MAVPTVDTLRVLPPDSPEYSVRRKAQIRDLWKMARPGSDIATFRRDLTDRLMAEMSRPTPRIENPDFVTHSLGKLRNTDGIPDRTKAILDSTGGGSSGGSVLVRQDLKFGAAQA